MFSLGILRGAEELVRCGPRRLLLAEFLKHATADASTSVGSSSKPGTPQGTGWDAAVDFSEVSVVYPGAQMATPWRVKHVWEPGCGLAIVGDNGSGKSTLALVLLGLIQPTCGEVRLGGTLLREHDQRALRQGVIFLPQGAYLDTGRSVEWHLRLVAGDAATEEQLLRVLRAVELEDALSHHAPDGQLAPLEVSAGELSGGERRRLHLARAFLPRTTGHAELIVLDEPEAGLDEAGRFLLKQQIEGLAARARVILIAHDTRVIPDGFDILRCERGAPD